VKRLLAAYWLRMRMDTDSWGVVYLNNILKKELTN
jgi:hypothetical protein